MKKGIKILLSCLAGVALLTCGVFATYSLKNKNLGGSIVRPVEHEEEGTYGWRKHEVNIPYKTYDNTSEWESNNSGDFITHLWFGYEHNIFSSDKLLISYYQNFEAADDLQAFFVLTSPKGIYVTDIINSNFPWWPEEYKIDLKDADEYDLYNSAITEIWVRTED